MNKELIIQKLTFITEEMRQQTLEWEKNGLRVTNLEVDAFISNIKYLIEQAEFLNDLLLDEQQVSEVGDQKSEMDERKPTIETEKPEVGGQRPEAGGQKLEENKSESPMIDDRNKASDAQSVVNSQEENKSESPMINDRNKMDETRSGVQNTQPAVEDRTIKAEENKSAIENPKSEISRNQQHKSEQDSLLERLKKMYSEKSLGDQLKEKNTVKDFTFSLNERFFVINQVFNGQHEVFDQMVDSVRDKKSWNEAEQFLNTTYAQKYQWENKSSEVEQFFHLMRGRFTE